MDGTLLGILLAAAGIAVPLVAFLWEFAVVGRKQLGYRVQLDTELGPGIDPEPPPAADALDLLGRVNGNRRLTDPSLVLIRIENSGTTHIDSDDYAVATEDRVGMRINFPGRKVVGMAAREFSEAFVGENFGEGSALAKREIREGGRTVGVIDLPRTPLNRGAHFKILALLERADPAPSTTRAAAFETPRVVGGIKGGVGNGGIRVTRSRTGISWLMAVMICVLAVTVVEVGRSVFFAPTPIDCVAGQITLVGSTAFEPVVRETADTYRRSCPGASFAFEFGGSAEGLRLLDERGAQSGGDPNVLAFSDGPKPDGLPQLLPRPAAFSLFTVVANRDADVLDLSLDQIRRIYAGEVTRWSEVGGADVPIRLVSREPDSGTRRTFQGQVLAGQREPGTNSDDCVNPDPGAPVDVIRCERSSTTELLDAVRAVPGALGYSELGAAAGRTDVVPVRIGGQDATVEAAVQGAYPFWQTEYAYTYAQPAAMSLTASFLRYLTAEVGQDVVRAHGLLPCTELANPVLCRPAT